ncbi:MAG TPA: methyltransferase domain-containing protein [Lachnospiraceae bacterium]|nr:methyltransferase domain-containing protein [Lachnospiraceae bacterium]
MAHQNMISIIRENECISHTEMYISTELFSGEGWLKKPVSTVMNLLPLFENQKYIDVLDLGCGIGRNCIPIAHQFKNQECHIDCVDILDVAIDKLMGYADKYGVTESINGILMPIDDFAIPKNRYNLIISVSSLEHMDSAVSFVNKLSEIAYGAKEKGIVCLIINSEVSEEDLSTGDILTPQFEVNLLTKELQRYLLKTFKDWNVLKSSVVKQEYNIPRGAIQSHIKTNVVTFVARKV